MILTESRTIAQVTKPMPTKPKSSSLRGRLMRKRPKQPMRWDEYEVVK